MKSHGYFIISLLATSVSLTACAETININPSHKTRVQSSNVLKNVNILNLGPTKIHTFYGISNAHIIETANELRVVDAQMTLSSAQKLKRYIEGLNKPLKAVILSHNHPDHWFGAEVFSAEKTPIIASLNTAKDLAKGGQRYIKIMKKKLKDNMPNTVIKLTGTVALGAQTWDGEEVIVEEYKDHESHHSILIKFPKHGVMIGQDLFYNNMFLVASERKRNMNWINILKDFQKNEAKDYKTILVGHGKNTTPDVFQQNIDYLVALEAILKKKLSKEATKKALFEQFPNKKGEGFLSISLRNLFSAPH
ncbi:MAG: MBL fold metallo-hydrolase [Cocleimonas sp.]|nr:MBL fold metallo-hydrolase [Cocleimonas sp.]